jgi:hypothetical protein
MLLGYVVDGLAQAVEIREGGWTAHAAIANSLGAG